MEIIWSPRSLEKFEEIGDYIALDAPDRAVSFIERLVSSVEHLRDFPMSGQITKDNVRKQAPPKGLPTGPFT